VSFGLDRVQLALERLGWPERRFRAVQIAGTNGKGSTAAFLESILRAAGLHTGSSHRRICAGFLSAFASTVARSRANAWASLMRLWRQPACL